jgi:hypothetical protein
VAQSLRLAERDIEYPNISEERLERVVQVIAATQQTVGDCLTTKYDSDEGGDLIGFESPPSFLDRPTSQLGEIKTI